MWMSASESDGHKYNNICVCMYTGIQMYVCIHIQMYVCIHIVTLMLAGVCICAVYACTHAWQPRKWGFQVTRVYIHAHVFWHVCIHIIVYTHMCFGIYVYISWPWSALLCAYVYAWKPMRDIRLSGLFLWFFLCAYEFTFEIYVCMYAYSDMHTHLHLQDLEFVIYYGCCCDLDGHQSVYMCV